MMLLFAEVENELESDVDTDRPVEMKNDILRGKTVLSGNVHESARDGEGEGEGQEEGLEEEDEWDEDKGSVTESEYKKYVKDADIEDYLRGEWGMKEYCVCGFWYACCVGVVSGFVYVCVSFLCCDVMRCDAMSCDVLLQCSIDSIDSISFVYIKCVFCYI
jgi:hypothetical protein